MNWGQCISGSMDWPKTNPLASTVHVLHNSKFASISTPPTSAVLRFNARTPSTFRGQKVLTGFARGFPELKHTDRPSSHCDSLDSVVLCPLEPTHPAALAPATCGGRPIASPPTAALPKAHSRCTADYSVSRPPLTAAATATLSGTVPGHVGRPKP